jgi:hypothetical protein
MRNNAEVSNMFHLVFNFLYIIRCKYTKKMRWTTYYMMLQRIFYGMN